MVAAITEEDSQKIYSAGDASQKLGMLLKKNIRRLTHLRMLKKTLLTKIRKLKKILSKLLTKLIKTLKKMQKSWLHK